MSNIWLGAITVLIAVTASFGEILSKNQSRPLSDIFNRYLLLYLGLNGVFAYLTYHFLPDIAQLVLKPEDVTWATTGLGRVFVAAFGYLVIVRTKFLTIGETPIGLDALYNAFAGYCLRHTNILIQNRESDLLDAIYDEFKELERYEYALTDRLRHAPVNEQPTIQAQAEAIKNALTVPEHIKCKRYAELLLRIVGSKEALRGALRSVPDEALTDSTLA